MSYTNTVAVKIYSINVDGTNEITSVSGPSWIPGGNGFAMTSQAWADSYTDGRDVLMLNYDNYGTRLSAISFDDLSAATKLISYKSTNMMDGYVAGNSYQGVAWVDANGEQTIVVSGKDVNDGATLWFYNADDIVNAANLYDPQPYATLNIADELLVGTYLSGMTYDPVGNVLYACEGSFQEPTVVHAWSVVVPEPITLALLAMGGVLGPGVRRRRA